MRLLHERSIHRPRKTEAMQQHTSSPDEKTVVGEIDDGIAAGLTHESKGITAIPWLFALIGVAAIAIMVLFLVHNR